MVNDSTQTNQEHNYPQIFIVKLLLENDTKMAPFYRRHPRLYHMFTFVYMNFAFPIEFVNNWLGNLGLPARRRARLPSTMVGKVVVITGGNAGIGKENVKTFTTLGAFVIMGCRDMEKAVRVVKEIISELDEDKQNNLQLFELNLSSFESVRVFAKKVRETVNKIDVLVNNAGIMMCPESRSEDGFELQMATNHLGHFLLTHLLIDGLRAAASSRIVNVSSVAYRNGVIHLDNINSEGIYNKVYTYCGSKLANVLFTRELARRLHGTNVTAYVLHPGLIRSELTRHLSLVIRTAVLAVEINTKLGAQTTLHCALKEGLEKYSGEFFINCRRALYLFPHATDAEMARRFWDLSLELCNIDDRITVPKSEPVANQKDTFWTRRINPSELV